MAKKETGKKPVGRPKAISSPEELYSYFEEYKQHLKENPIELEDFVGKDAKKVTRKHQKPPTWQGFETLLYKKGVIYDLDDYRKNTDGRYEDFRNIIRAISNEMWDSKFSGAAVGQWNQNIIAKEIGLIDKQQVTQIQRPFLEGGKELPNDE